MPIIVQKSSRVGRPLPEVLLWLSRAATVDRLVPPWWRDAFRRPGQTADDGQTLAFKLQRGPWSFEWRFFRSFQGASTPPKIPAADAVHVQSLERSGPAHTVINDEVRLTLSSSKLKALLSGATLRREVERMLNYQHAQISEDLALGDRYGSARSLKILVSGASGFVGRALVVFLQSQGHAVRRLVRGKPKSAEEIFWDPGKEALSEAKLAGFDAVIHLAGENIAGGRWTEKRRSRIRQSRVEGTRLLVSALGRLRIKPAVFICASGGGFYGNTGENIADETAPQGGGFLAEVCAAWEQEALAAEAHGMRVVCLRTGVVLAPEGGALRKMLPAFRAGVGGALGGGSQWMSWISREDLIGAIYHSILDQRCRGPVNAVSPQPVRNKEFTATLARVVHRVAWLPVPGFLLKILFGQMAEEALLASSRLHPQKLLSSGYVFRHERLEDALRHELGELRVRQRG